MDLEATTLALIAPCGMNCAICGGYLAREYDVKSNGIRMPYCAGCRPRGRVCAFLKRKCNLLLNKRVQYCYECKCFPCDRLLHLDKRYRTLFRMSMVENLNFIQKNGVQEFLDNERKRWTCRKCGGTISCHNGICFQCGLDELRSRKRRYRWEDD